LREERRLRVFENRVLRRVFGPKRDELRGEWRKLHNEELNDLYSLRLYPSSAVYTGQHDRLICCHNIDRFYTDLHIKPYK
jgi:hypothetical protein